MELIRSHKGAISIFLIIMLLPMVTYATIIIDGARVITSRTTIANAGDLAMNAALSEYDQTLEDMYGLFATAASEEDLKMQLKSYFAQTLEGRFYTGQRGDYSTQQLTDDVIDAIFQYEEDTQGIANFIRMKTEEFDCSPVQDSSLANQAIMKRQIVEYMKYKGPVSLASNLFGKLDFLKDSASQTEVLEKKVEYTEKLDSIQDACEAALQALYAYNRSADTYNSKYGEGTGTVEKIIKNMEKDYQCMSACLIMEKNSNIKEISWNDLDAEGLSEVQAVCDRIEAYDTSMLGKEETKLSTIQDMLNDIWGIYEDNIKNWIDIGMNVEYPYVPAEQQEQAPYQQTVEFSLKSGKGTGVEKDVTPYKDRLDGYVNDLGTAIQSDWESGEPYVRDLMVYFQKLNEANKFANDAISDLIKLKAACTTMEHLNGLYASVFYNYKNKYEAEYKKQYIDDHKDASEEDVDDALKKAEKSWTDIQDTNNPYHQFESEYYTCDWHGYVISTVWRKIKESGYLKSIQDLINKVGNDNIYEVNADNYAARAAKDINDYYNCVKDVEAKALACVGYLDSVIEELEDAEKAKKDWQKKINALPSGSTKTSMQSDLKSTTEGLKKSDVKALQKVMNDISDQFFKKEREILDPFTEQKDVLFCGISPIECKESEPFLYMIPFQNAATLTETNTADDLVKMAESLVDKELQVPKAVTKEITAEEIDGSDGLKNDERFFLTLKSICEPYKTEEKNTKQDEAVDKVNQMREDAQKEAKKSNTTTEQKTPEKETSKGDNSSSGNSGGSGNSGSGGNGDNGDNAKEDKAVSKDIGEIYKTIDSVAKAGSGSDNMQMSDVSNMKVETEKKDNYKKESQKARSALKSANSLLSSLKNIAVKARDYAYLEEYFTEMFTCRTFTSDELINEKPQELKLLNGYSPTVEGDKHINTKTNWYGKEIEYIIWGDPDLNNNLTYTDAWIYLVRFALNAIYAFTSSDIQMVALEMATAIAGWTVVGVPIVQACITLGLAVAESAYDIVLLHEGKDVPIYKNAQTFVCSPAGLANVATDEITDYVEKKVENAIDKKIDQLANEAYATMDEAMGDVDKILTDYVDNQAEGILSSVTDQFATPIVNALTPILNSVDMTRETAVNKVDQLEENINSTIDTVWNNIYNSINDSLPDGIAKDLALKAYDNGGEDIKGKLKEEIQKYFNKVTGINDKLPQDSVSYLREQLVGVKKGDDGKTEGTGIISSWIYGYRDTIEGEIKKLTKKTSQKIKDMGDEGVKNLKSTLHDELGSMTTEISGSVSEKISDSLGNTISDNMVSDSASSNGFTLNYKEYCKIMVFVKLIENKEGVMLNRAAALIEANVQAAEDNDQFGITKTCTLVKIDATVRLKTFFPWAVKVEDSTDVDGSTGIQPDLTKLGEYDVDIHYQGINGY